MNDYEDYDFGNTRNSRLSSIFSQDNSSESGNTSLIYKPPKQPVSGELKEAKTSSRFFYKFINLYEMSAENLRQLGNHIIALIRSDANISEILVYQTKCNIIIRKSVDTKSVFIYPKKKFSRSLLANDRMWILEFNSNEDLTEFDTELSKFGGILEYITSDKAVKVIPNEKGNSHITSQYSETLSNIQEKPYSSNLDEVNISTRDVDLLSTFTYKTRETDFLASKPLFSFLDVDQTSIGSVNVQSLNTSNDNKEKEDILARLAKMGLPQLPSFPKELKSEISSNLSKEEGSVKICSNDCEERFSGIGTNEIVKYDYSIEGKDKVLTNSDIARTPYHVKQNVEVTHDSSLAAQINMLNGTTLGNTLTMLLTENRINNTELQHKISALAEKLNEGTESSDAKALAQLRSKFKSLQLKTENLEGELYKSRKYCDKLEQMKEELSSKLESTGISWKNHTCKDSFSQTEPLNNECVGQIDAYKVKIRELLNFVKCLPLKYDEVNIQKLEEFREKIDGVLSQDFITYIDFIEQNMNSYNTHIYNSNISQRNHFITVIRRIMSDMYSNICANLGESSDKIYPIASHMRNVTSALVNAYDESIEIGKKC